MVHLARVCSLALVLAGLSCAELTTVCVNHTSPVYQLNLTQLAGQRIQSSGGSLEPLYNFARLFLDAVQPNKFPLDIVSRAIRDGKLDTAEVVRYEAGYVVCLIVAVLYVLLIPIVGVVLLWHHCHHKNVVLCKSSSPLPQSCWEITAPVCLGITAILLLAGVILAFSTNNKARENMRPNLRVFQSNTNDIKNTLHSIPQKLEIIVEQFSVPQEKMARELTGIGHVIGGAIISSFSTAVSRSLNDLSLTIQDFTGARRNLMEVTSVRAQMQNQQSVLRSGLEGLRIRIDSLRKNCSNSCDFLNTTGVETDADYSMIPAVDAWQQALSSVRLDNNIVEQGNSSFYSIPQVCSQQVAPQVDELVLSLNETKNLFANFSHRFPSLESLSDVMEKIDSVLERYGKHLDYYDYVRWAVVVVFCTLILIIVLFMIAALSVGLPRTLKPTIYPTHMDNNLRLTAVYLLRVAAWMTFLFSWLFIIMVFVALFVGGNAHSLGCRSSTTGEMFEFIDTQGSLFSSLQATNDLSPDNTTQDLSSANTTQPPQPSTSPFTTLLYNFTTIPSTSQSSPADKMKVRTSEVYHGCLRGQSMYYSMHMDEMFNMSHFLNVSKYLGRLEGNIQSLSVSVDSVTLLPDSGRNAIQNFRDRANLDRIDYHTFRLLLGQPVVKRNLSEFAKNLEAAAQLPGNEPAREALLQEARVARDLSVTVEEQISNARRMKSSVEVLSMISTNYKGNADRSLQSTQQAADAVRLGGPDLVQEVILCLLDRTQELLQQYLDWVKHAVIHEVLDCKWLPVSLGNMYTAACQNVIDPWNAFWLSLGWCCALLVPGVIFSICTARLWKPLPPVLRKDPLEEDKEKTEEVKANIYISIDQIRELGIMDKPCDLDKEREEQDDDAGNT